MAGLGGFTHSIVDDSKLIKLGPQLLRDNAPLEMIDWHGGGAPLLCCFPLSANILRDSSIMLLRLYGIMDPRRSAKLNEGLY